MSAPGARVVAITGASSGIGRATAQYFARHGWRVGLIARSEENLGAADLELTADLAEIDQAAAGIDVQGDRYPEHLQRLVEEYAVENVSPNGALPDADGHNRNRFLD